MKYDVWTIHKSKTIQLTEFGGVPVSVTFVSPDAKDPAHPTISEVMFDPACLNQFDDFQEAAVFARSKADELGYQYEDLTLFD